MWRNTVRALISRREVFSCHLLFSVLTSGPTEDQIGYIEHLRRRNCHTRFRSWSKVFPLALGISISLCITAVALVITCSSRIRSSLAHGVHLGLDQ